MSRAGASRYCTALVVIALAAAAFAATGCGGEGQPTFLSFTGKGSDSADSMKPVIVKLKKKYADEVIFREIDMDDPASKAEVEKYHVTMNPTFIVLNTKGQVKETYMGAAQEDMLDRAIASFIPGKAEPAGTTPTTPGYPSAPDSPSPGVVETVPVNPNP